MSKEGRNPKKEKDGNRGKFINLAEIGLLYNMHHWLKGWIVHLRNGSDYGAVAQLTLSQLLRGDLERWTIKGPR